MLGPELEIDVKIENSKLPIPEFVSKLSHEKQQQIQDYLNQMNETEKKAYRIALNHLGSSFNIYKSNGYIEWYKKRGL